MLSTTQRKEIFEEHSILSKFKEGDNFNRRRPAGSALGVNTLEYFED